MDKPTTFARSLVRRVRRRRGDGGLRAGQVEGWRTTDTARLKPRRRETQRHHAGFLVAHLMRWLRDRGWAANRSMLAPAHYALAVTTPTGQEFLGKVDAVPQLHLFAARAAEATTQTLLPEVLERLLYGWLCEQAGVEWTADRVEELERLRATREGEGAGEVDDAEA